MRLYVRFPVLFDILSGGRTLDGVLVTVQGGKSQFCWSILQLVQESFRWLQTLTEYRAPKTTNCGFVGVEIEVLHDPVTHAYQ